MTHDASDALAPVFARCDPDRPLSPISANPDRTTVIFLGKRFPYGFGADLPFEAARILMAALADVPAQDRLRTGWWTSREDLRDQYCRQTLKWFGYSGLCLSDIRLTEAHPHADHLHPQRVYDGLTFDHITQPREGFGEVVLPSLPIVLSWRHATFTNAVVGQRLVHLRTKEMIGPDAVWDRIQSLFSDYCSFLRRQTFTRLKPRDRLMEDRSLLLALYERLLWLHYEEATGQPRYRSAISRRQPHPTMTDDVILDPNTNPLTGTSLADAQFARQMAYYKLLRTLLNRTVNELKALSSNHS